MAHKTARGRAPYKARYAAYNTLSRYSKNKRAKITAHLKAHPEDDQAKKSLGKVETYKRKSSGSSTGLSSIDKRFAQIKAASQRAMNALIYAEKKFPSNPDDMDARIMATMSVQDWPAALRKRYRGKSETKDTKELS